LESFGHQDDGEGRLSVVDRMREAGEDLRVASRRLNDEELRAKALQDERGQLQQKRTLASAGAEQLSLGANRDRSEFESSLELATKAYTGISIEQVRARLDACIGDGPEQFDLSREAAASEYKRCQQDAADRTASVRTLEQSASAARREVERLRATGILAARAE